LNSPLVSSLSFSLGDCDKSERRKNYENETNRIRFLFLFTGVGFSYSDTPSDYTTGDYQSSQDVLAFMLGFLQRYPQYANRPFFISGERLVQTTREIYLRLLHLLHNCYHFSDQHLSIITSLTNTYQLSLL